MQLAHPFILQRIHVPLDHVYPYSQAPHFEDDKQYKHPLILQGKLFVLLLMPIVKLFMPGALSTNK